jgi:hypothetical protein
MAMRSALHRAGAAAMSQLLEFPAPGEEERTRPCSCGQAAHYRGLHGKAVLTVLGQVEVLRPYYLCACGVGQFPVDVELDIEDTEFSPGVRRMQALVGHEVPFDDGRETDENPGGPGGEHEIGGAHGRRGRSRYRSTRTSGDPESPAIGLARDRGLRAP